MGANVLKAWWTAFLNERKKLSSSFVDMLSWSVTICLAVKLFDVANQGHCYIVNSLRTWEYPIGDPVQFLNWFLAWKWGCVLLWPEVIFFSSALRASLTRLRREVSIRKKYPLEPRVTTVLIWMSYFPITTSMLSDHKPHTIWGYASGRVPFDQNVRKFRFKIEWNRHFPEIRSENFDSPLVVVLFSGNLEIPEISCSIWHFYPVWIGPSSFSREKLLDGGESFESTLHWMQNVLP